MTYFLNSFVNKKSRAEVCKLLDFVDSPSNTLKKWPLVFAQKKKKGPYFMVSNGKLRIHFEKSIHPKNVQKLPYFDSIGRVFVIFWKFFWNIKKIKWMGASKLSEILWNFGQSNMKIIFILHLKMSLSIVFFEFLRC